MTAGLLSRSGVPTFAACRRPSPGPPREAPIPGSSRARPRRPRRGMGASSARRTRRGRLAGASPFGARCNDEHRDQSFVSFALGLAVQLQLSGTQDFAWPGRRLSNLEGAACQMRRPLRGTWSGTCLTAGGGPTLTADVHGEDLEYLEGSPNGRSGRRSSCLLGDRGSLRQAPPFLERDIHGNRKCDEPSERQAYHA